jgi:hypothetical protein
VAERNRTALRVDSLVVVGETELTGHREALRSEGLVELDEVDLIDRQAGLLEQLARGRSGSDPHDARWNTCDGRGDHARLGREPEALHCGLRGDQQRAGTVVDARRVAGRHGAGLAKRCPQLRERFERRVRSRMLVAIHLHDLALAACDRHRDDLLSEPAALLRSDRLLLARQCEAILRLTRHAVLGSDVLCRLGHRVDAVLRLHQRVHEAPADRGVEDLGIAAERARRLALHERCTRHRLDAARYQQVHLASLDRAGRDADRVHAGAAQPVDRRARDLGGQPGEQGRHARDVSVVLARLVRAAVDHVLDRADVEPRVALTQCLDRDRPEVVGTYGRQRASVAANGGADRVTDECVSHDDLQECRRFGAL